jgi:hypothetical protein
MVSSADANGADLGIRQAWGPLFDRHGVDLAVCGHDHDYERSFAVRGAVSGSETLTPRSVSAECPSHTNTRFLTGGRAKVVTAVARPGTDGRRPRPT